MRRHDVMVTKHGDHIGGERDAIRALAPDARAVVGMSLGGATSLALAAHAPDGGNNISIAVYPSPGSLP